MRQASFPAFLALSPLAFILAGCATVDPPELPKMAVPASFHHGADWTTATPADALDRGDWWHAFGDPVLDGLMVKVDTTTPTLAAALARYDQALANAREAGQTGTGPPGLRERAGNKGVSGGQSVHTSPSAHGMPVGGVRVKISNDLSVRVVRSSTSTSASTSIGVRARAGASANVSAGANTQTRTGARAHARKLTTRSIQLPWGVT